MKVLSGDDVNPLCQYERTADQMVCSQCGNTRPYRENCRRNCPASKSRGLGDTIAKLTHANGIAQVVDAVSIANGRKRCQEPFPGLAVNCWRSQVVSRMQPLC